MSFNRHTWIVVQGVRDNMADIELVIKIPEEMYKDIQSRDWKNGKDGLVKNGKLFTKALHFQRDTGD